MNMLSIDLIMTTCNRHECVKRLLDSLCQQKLKNFHLIAGLQEPDNKMLLLFSKYNNYISIETHIFEKCSLSKARNKLLEYVSSDIVALTDDDCWYPADFTSSIANFFLENPVGGCIGTYYKNKKTFFNAKINRFSVFFNAPSWLLFFRRDAMLRTGKFDIELGVGADTPWQSGEETDFALRFIKCGENMLRTSSIIVMHPDISPTSHQKWYGYGLGRMRVLKKHNFPLWFRLLNVFYPLVKLLYVPYQFWPCYLTMFKARLKGLLLL